jgi:hypothetical protein
MTSEPDQARRERAEWGVHTLTRPENSTFYSLLDDLAAKLGNKHAAMSLNLTTARLENYLARRRIIGVDLRIGIWLLHSIIFHPERVSSLAHILTWGRYAKPQEARRAVPAVWSVRKGKLRITRKAKRKLRKSNKDGPNPNLV